MVSVRLSFFFILFALAPRALAQCEIDVLDSYPPVVNENYGAALAVDGAVAVVGSNPYLAPNRRGTAHVAVRLGNTWYPWIEMVSPDAHDVDRFGFAVAVQGLRAFVGSPSGSELGTVYVY